MRHTLAGNNLTRLYNDVELQITCCEKKMGVHFDDNLEWANHFHVKDFVFPVAFFFSD